MEKIFFNKVALQLYSNHTSAWLFFFKFAAYFKNHYLLEHLSRTASVCFGGNVESYWLLHVWRIVTCY